MNSKSGILPPIRNKINIDNLVQYKLCIKVPNSRHIFPIGRVNNYCGLLPWQRETIEYMRQSAGVPINLAISHGRPADRPETVYHGTVGQINVRLAHTRATTRLCSHVTSTILLSTHVSRTHTYLRSFHASRSRTTYSICL
jgi:hypothetical protein